MAIMPPDTALWHEVVAEQGLQAVWPIDGEDTTRALGDVWSRLADEIGEGGFQVSQAAEVVASSWPDPAGATAVDAVTAYFDRLEENSLQMAFVATLCRSYAIKIEQAKTAVKDTIAGWEEAYAAAGVPRAGKDTAYEQSLVVYHAAQKCFLIMDNAARAVQDNLLRQNEDQDLQERKGAVDLWRQLVGNVPRLGNLLSGPQNNLVLGGATAAKTELDREAGKPADQAVVSNTAGMLVNMAVGTVVRPMPLGMLAGMTAGAFTSGAVDSLYENGPTHHATAMARGGERVADTYEGLGEAIGDLAEDVRDLFGGGGKP